MSQFGNHSVGWNSPYPGVNYQYQVGQSGKWTHHVGGNTNLTNTGVHYEAKTNNMNHRVGAYKNGRDTGVQYEFSARFK